MKAEYISFTDAGVFYKIDTIVSGGLDITDRIQFEATNLPQDTIAIEADDSGRLTGFPISGSDRYAVRAGQILSASVNGETISVSGSQFASLSGILLSSSINNFEKLYILQSPDPVDDKEKQFIIGGKNKNFIITDKRPFGEADIKVARIDHLEGFFQDKKLSHIPNYKFMPPVNKARLGTTENVPLGEYVNLNQNPIITYKDVLTEISGFEKMGFAETFKFTETSRQNNLFGQFFEVSAGQMVKLDVIDFGEFLDENKSSKHVFFAGKVYLDDYGVATFVNIFTIIFE